MSDYIIALLKHEAIMSDEDWKQVCVEPLLLVCSRR